MAQVTTTENNVDRVIRFDLDGKRWERRLVCWPVRDMATELNVASPVGRVLRSAQVGQELPVHVPSGDLVVKVLEIVE